MDTHVNSEEENISEVGACAAHNFLETRKTLKSTSTIESLPGDVVFDILARVPAHDIHSAARLVCSKWYQTIRTRDFMRAHLQQSTCGLVFQHNDSDVRNETLMFATPKGVEISYYKFRGEAFSSCNGLVLERHEINKTESEIRITNPVTNQHMGLPSFGGKPFHNSAIAYAVASKEYKVVCPFYSHSSGRLVECAILTVGVDEDWKRRVDIRHLSPSAKDLLDTEQIPALSTDGFVHWAAQYDSSGRVCEFVVTLNVETEIITQFPSVPRNLCGCDGETKLLYRYLPMGRCLSLLIGRMDNKLLPTWDQVWVMEPETGEWTKMASIDSGFSEFLPVGWLKFREVLVFDSLNWSSCTEICIAYNVRTHEIETLFELDFIPPRFIVHRNSLVWLD